MNDLIFRLYSLIHLTAKKFLGRKLLKVSPYILRYSGISGCDNLNTASNFWNQFVDDSIIKQESEFLGFHYAGYILETEEWCLPSWIWTNAAIVRMYVQRGEIEKAKFLCDKLAGCQLKCGGWIVRNDYDSKGAIPMLAPNDSAYIANNAFLSVYGVTKDDQYLEVAKRCASWIMSTCREDGMVYTGFNMRDNLWDKNAIIVDVGFTGGLFANLYKFTGDVVYKEYLMRFINRYIQLFFMPENHGFATSINQNDKVQGGMFGRGQAWALEGLIPAYEVLYDNNLKNVIEKTVDNLIKTQNGDGSWSYNLTRKLMGNDCKAVPVIAWSLMKWYSISQDTKILKASQKALEWCLKHTKTQGDACGGIFSFCVEGGIVKNLYSSCAFVYSSAYALELKKQIYES